MSDERLNTAIDEVARRMTETAPDEGAAFRRRVIARIEAGDAPRGSRRPLVVSVALAAAIVGAVMVARSSGPKEPALHPTGQIASRPDPSGPGVPAPPVPAMPERGTAGPKGSAAQRVPAASTAANRAADGRALPGGSAFAPVPPLDRFDVATIAVAPLAVDALTPDSIQIQRLDEIAPITVAPLDITDAQRRDP
jgi:hypothetical protein